MTTVYYNLDESPLFQATNLLEDFSIDYAEFSIRHRHWNYEQMWRKFIRSN